MIRRQLPPVQAVAKNLFIGMRAERRRTPHNQSQAQAGQCCYRFASESNQIKTNQSTAYSDDGNKPRVGGGSAYRSNVGRMSQQAHAATESGSSVRRQDPSARRTNFQGGLKNTKKCNYLQTHPKPFSQHHEGSRIPRVQK